MDLLYIRSASGKLVPLSAIARVTQDVGPQVVNHVGQLPAVTLSFNIKANTPLNVAMDEVNKAAKEALPDEITSSFQGTAQAFKQSMSGLPILLALAVIVIYIVLGILYENFVYPLVILAALPFALFGALMTLLIFNAQLTIYAYVGVIMLIGLVMKNGIMVVDFALEAQSEGKSPEEAVHQASLIRFRPIMMTTMSAFMGTLPIALGIGAGGDSRQPLGLAVVGGLVFSQLLTFFVTPVIFIYMERLQRRLSAKKENPTIGAKA
jgi:HAE1 family hydrophobic/amphiphilic exporter-1